MSIISQWKRLWQIRSALLRYNVIEILVPKKSWLHLVTAVVTLSPKNKKPNPTFSRGMRLRLTLQELGPFFIKFGQLLATRRDILPDDIADELCKLQDQVAPFTTPDPRAVVTQSLGLPLKEVFSAFNPEPLASASIAQVHAATLKNGQDVVVKVLRPHIKTIIKQDIYWLKNISRCISRFVPQGTRLIAVVKEIEETIYAELDFEREAANMSQFKRMQNTLPCLHVPDVVWPLNRRDLLVMERIHGIPFSNITAIKQSGVNTKLLAEHIIRLFFKQVFDYGFFHADLHAGNLFLATQPLDPPHIIMVDFGIIGILNANDLSYLAQNLHAFLKADYQRIAELHVESGWVPGDTRIEQLAGAISIVCEPLTALPLKEISFGTVMLRLLQTAAKFKAEVQPQLILLQKTLITAEGLSRHIYPDVDFFNIARETVENWIRKRTGIRGFLREMQKRASPHLAQQLPAIPELLFNYLQASLKEKQMPSKKVVVHSNKLFWRGVGTTSLTMSVFISTILALFPPESMATVPHLISLIFSIGLGTFAIGCLLYHRR